MVTKNKNRDGGCRPDGDGGYRENETVTETVVAETETMVDINRVNDITKNKTNENNLS